MPVGEISLRAGAEDLGSGDPLHPSGTQVPRGFRLRGVMLSLGHAADDLSHRSLPARGAILLPTQARARARYARPDITLPKLPSSHEGVLCTASAIG